MGRHPRAGTRFISFVSVCMLSAPIAARAQTASPPPAAAELPPAAGVAPRPAEVDVVRAEIDRLRDELTAVQQQYDERLIALEGRLAALVAAGSADKPAAQAPAEVPPPTPAPQDPAPPPPAPGAGQTSGKVFNPDTSVIGNFLAVGGKNPNATTPSLELTEAEVSFQAIVDPYARADFFLSASPDGLEVEEGFITFTSLPSHLLLKAGKMRAQFGRVNTLHTHGMPTADRPLVTQNLVGGEEGVSDSGISVSRLFPNSLLYLEAIGEVYSGSSEVFQSDRRSELTYVGRLRGYRDFSEDKNIDFGTSFAFGPTPDIVALPFDENTPIDPLHKRLIGIDATFRYRPLRRAIYRRLNLRTELIWSRQELGGIASTTAFGMYGLGEYQFAQRWYVGARLDRSGRAEDGTRSDKGASVFLTFWPTEFSQIRTQYRYTNYAEGVNANEAFLQFNFAIGAHGAHAF